MVSSVINRFQAVKKQSEVFQLFIPRWIHQAGPSTSRPVPISRREELKVSVGPRFPLRKDRSIAPSPSLQGASLTSGQLLLLVQLKKISPDARCLPSQHTHMGPKGVALGLIFGAYLG